jgi:hypothetical protein
MVSSEIGTLGYDKHLSRTKFDTKSAAFATFFNDMDDALRNSNAVFIERLPPIFHAAS